MPREGGGESAARKEGARGSGEGKVPSIWWSCCTGSLSHRIVRTGRNVCTSSSHPPSKAASSGAGDTGTPPDGFGKSLERAAFSNATSPVNLPQYSLTAWQHYMLRVAAAVLKQQRFGLKQLFRCPLDVSRNYMVFAKQKCRTEPRDSCEGPTVLTCISHTLLIAF